MLACVVAVCKESPVTQADVLQWNRIRACMQDANLAASGLQITQPYHATEASRNSCPTLPTNQSIPLSSTKTTNAGFKQGCYRMVRFCLEPESFSLLPAGVEGGTAAAFLVSGARNAPSSMQGPADSAQPERSVPQLDVHELKAEAPVKYALDLVSMVYAWLGQIAGNIPAAKAA